MSPSAPEPRSSTSGRPCARATATTSSRARQLGEADDAEVRLVHAEQERGVGADRPLVVGGARAVRRPDLDEARAGAREDVGDAEAVADLEQLAARDDDLAPLGERREREQHGGGVVVDDERRLGAREPAHERVDVRLARPARAGVEVELEVRVAARGGDDVRERLRRERRASQVGVHEDAGRVQHAAQARRARGRELLVQARGQVTRVGAAPNLFTRAREHGAGGVDGERIVDPACQLVHRRKVAQLHDWIRALRRASAGLRGPASDCSPSCSTGARSPPG